ncbi:MAG: putative regulatory protein FmdB family [Actinomycetia bacterium]|nr:putative regulatory protein FmdB family [Actinomycetes bacterium]
MPTYEYECEKCGQTLEAFQSFSETAFTRCSQIGCVAPGKPGDGKLVKVFGSVGIVLKGSGFYRTDNPSSSRKAGAKSDSSSSNSGSGSDGGSKSSDSGSSGSSDSGGSSSSDSSSTKKSDNASKPAKPSKSA